MPTILAVIHSHLPNENPNPNPNNGGGDSQEDTKKERRCPAAQVNIRWRDLLDPDLENIVAVRLTGLLTWASIQASKEEESYKNLNFLEGDNGKSKRKRTSELCEHYPPIKRPLPTKVDAFPFEKNSLQSLSKAMPFTEENIECVASCRGNNSPVNSFQNTRKNSRGNSENFFDETSSSSPKQKLATNIHELELHAYNSTVRALYASGPLCWEKESILTNLRMSLHISNEEHLLQLRNLLSA